MSSISLLNNALSFGFGSGSASLGLSRDGIDLDISVDGLQAYLDFDILTSTLSYTISDPEGDTAKGSAKITAGHTSGNPAVASSPLAVAENSRPSSIGIATPTDPNFSSSQLLVFITSLPTNGTVTVAGSSKPVVAGQMLTAAQLASLQFTPTANLFGKSSTLSFLVTDVLGNYTASSVKLSVGPAVGAPVVSSPQLQLSGTTAAVQIGIAQPSDPNYSASQLSIVVDTTPTDGTVTLAGSTQPVTAGQKLTAAQLTTLAFTPSSAAADTSSTLTYSVTDPSGNSATGTARFSVSGVASAGPVISTTSLTVAENSSATSIGIALPTDPVYASSTLSAVLKGLPTDGSVTLADGVTAVSAGETLTAVQLAGLKFTPASGVFGQSSALSYTVSDPAGMSASGSAVLKVGPAVGNPTVSSPTLNVAENAAATPIGLGHPGDPNYASSALTITVGSTPTDGMVTLADGVTAVTSGEVLTSAQFAGLDFTPGAGVFGQSSAFSYTASDPSGNSASGTATLSVGPAMGNPSVSSPTLTVPSNGTTTPIGISLASDPNYASSSLSASVLSLPTDGTVTLSDGTTPVTAGESLTTAQLSGLDFSPTASDVGQSSTLSYSVTDPSGNASISTATLAVGAPVYTQTTYNEGNAGGTVTTTGNDTVNVGSGAVSIYADGPSTTANGGTGQMTFYGSNGNDTVNAGAGYTTVNAGTGNLTFTAGTGNATIGANATGQETFNVIDGQAGGTIAIFGFIAGQDVIHAIGYSAPASEQIVPGATDFGLQDGTVIILPSFVDTGSHPVFA